MLVLLCDKQYQAPSLQIILARRTRRCKYINARSMVEFSAVSTFVPVLIRRRVTTHATWRLKPIIVAPDLRKHL